MFNLEAISSNLTPHPEWEVSPPPMEEVDQALHQKYRYLARGAQSFAFVSEDGRYVIKFFRMKHLLSKFKDHFRPGVVKRRQESLASIFGAHVLAWNELREESGLVFLHLNKTDHLKIQLPVTDWLGRRHQIDLDQTEFVVQRKAELIFTYLEKLKKSGGEESVKKAMDDFMDLIHLQQSKEIFDRDKAVSHNYGFVDGRPIHVDIGRLAKGDKPGEEERIRKRLEAWVFSQSKT